MANYLLGFGERLTEKIDPPKKPASKKHAYSFGEARERLAAHRLTNASRRPAR